MQDYSHPVHWPWGPKVTPTNYSDAHGEVLLPTITTTCCGTCDCRSKSTIMPLNHTILQIPHDPI